jgi:uncharacterized protein with FMN-binding domain
VEIRPVLASAPVTTTREVAPLPEAPTVAAIPKAREPEVRLRDMRRDASSTDAPAATVEPAPTSEAAIETAPAPVVTPTPAPPAIEAQIPAEIKPAEPPPPPARPALKDGSYTGWGTSRHGDIQATVVIEGGHIISAAISQCLTRYPCSWIAQLPGQVVSRQSPECDFVSGATQSTNAFYYAVVEALAKAK